MKAILREIEVPKYEDSIMRHPIKTLFADTEEYDEFYRFGTIIDTQFCAKDDYDVKEGLSDKINGLGKNKLCEFFN